MVTPAEAASCPDSEVYDRLSRLERGAARDSQRWEQQQGRNDKIDDLVMKVERLTTTIKVATAVMGFVLALAGVVIPLWKG